MEGLTLDTIVKIASLGAIVTALIRYLASAVWKAVASINDLNQTMSKLAEKLDNVEARFRDIELNQRALTDKVHEHSTDLAVIKRTME